MSLDEPQRIIRDAIGQVAWLVDQLTVPDHRRAVVGTAAFLVRVPMRKAMLRRGAIAQVPFPTQPADISALGEHIRVGCQPRQILDRGVAILVDIATDQPVMDTVLRRDASGQEGRASRGTDGRRTEESREARTSGGEAIEMWRPDLAVVSTSHRPCPLIVRQDDDDIRLVRGVAGS